MYLRIKLILSHEMCTTFELISKWSKLKLGNVFILFQRFNYKLRFNYDIELFLLPHIGAGINNEVSAKGFNHIYK